MGRKESGVGRKCECRSDEIEEAEVEMSVRKVKKSQTKLGATNV
jgi:hypothetical protein